MNKKIKRRLFFFCGCLLAAAGQAATWYVKTNGNDSDLGSDWNTALLTISNAVFKAPAPDTVLVSNGIYKLTAQISIAKGITIKSLNGRDVTFVDGNYPAATCFNINHVSAVVDGFTITNGARGVYLNDGLLLNCTISGNSVVDYGSGVFLAGGTVKNCIISKNVATGRGGAVTFWNGSGILQDSYVINNTSACYGGGISFWATMGGLISNCTIVGNTCGASGGDGGGGVYCYGGARTSIVQNCTIVSNYSPSGGGVYANGLNLQVLNCRISANSANSCGGVVGGPPTILQNCLIDGNTPNAVGTFYGWISTLRNCTVVSNGPSGGIFNCAALNSIVYFNNGAAGSSNWSGSSFINSCTAPLSPGSNNIATNPMLVQVQNNYRLLCGSPCINKGTNQDWMTLPGAGALDLDGRPRIRKDIVDMGAYEWFPKGTFFRGK